MQTIENGDLSDIGELEESDEDEDVLDTVKIPYEPRSGAEIHCKNETLKKIGLQRRISSTPAAMMNLSRDLAGRANKKINRVSWKNCKFEQEWLQDEVH